MCFSVMHATFYNPQRQISPLANTISKLITVLCFCSRFHLQRVLQTGRSGKSCHGQACRRRARRFVLLPMGKLFTPGSGLQCPLQDVGARSYPHQRKTAPMWKVRKMFFASGKPENPPSLSLRRKTIRLPG